MTVQSESKRKSEDDWLKAQRVRRENDMAKTQAMVSKKDVERLVDELRAKAARHVAMAQRLYEASLAKDFAKEVWTASVVLQAAAEVVSAYTDGRPIALRSRLEQAQSSLQEDFLDVQRWKDLEKALVKAAAKQAKAAVGAAEAKAALRKAAKTPARKAPARKVAA